MNAPIETYLNGALNIVMPTGVLRERLNTQEFVDGQYSKTQNDFPHSYPNVNSIRSGRLPANKSRAGTTSSPPAANHSLRR